MCHAFVRRDKLRQIVIEGRTGLFGALGALVAGSPRMGFCATAEGPGKTPSICCAPMEMTVEKRRVSSTCIADYSFWGARRIRHESLMSVPNCEFLCRLMPEE